MDIKVFYGKRTNTFACNYSCYLLCYSPLLLYFSVSYIVLHEFSGTVRSVQDRIWYRDFPYLQGSQQGANWFKDLIAWTIKYVTSICFLSKRVNETIAKMVIMKFLFSL